MFITSKIRYYFVFVVLVSILFSCKDDTEENPVNPAYVNFSLYLNDPEFQDLKIPGNYAFIRAGGASLVIYRTTIDDFVAFDRMCTYEAKPDVLVVSDSSTVMVRCPICESKFILVDGSPQDGPAKHMLRPYNVTYDGGDYIHVSN